MEEKNRLKSTFLPCRIKKHHSTLDMDNLISIFDIEITISLIYITVCIWFEKTFASAFNFSKDGKKIITICREINELGIKGITLNTKYYHRVLQ